MRKTRKIIVMITALVAIFTAMMFVAACGDDEKYTMTFVADGTTTRITAKAGEAVDAPADPEKDGYEFVGWYTDKDFNGDAVQIPDVMPKRNVTYYARFVEQGVRLEYVFNLPNVQHGGEVTAQVGEKGQTVKVKDGADYGANGWRFVGWSINPTGEVSLTGEKKAGQYDPDDDFTLGDNDAVLYAQWSREYTDARNKSADKIYVYEPLVGKGLGAATLVRTGKPDKLGFVTEDGDGTGFTEFEFMFEPADGGDVRGRLYDDFTYMYASGEKLTLLEYDYVTETAGARVLAMDEYDYAVVMRNAGNQMAVDMYGYFVFDEEYGDYVYEYTDSNGKSGETFFSYELAEIEGTEFDGYFTLQGAESGSYLQYDNGELLSYKLHLNGYGAATLYVSDATGEATGIVASGKYRGTENYQDAFGEWEFVGVNEDGITANVFKFVLNTADAGSEILYLYIEYNAALDKTYTAAVGDGTLSLNGYGVARYTVSGDTYSGNSTVSGTLVTFIPSVLNENANPDAQKMYFNVDDDAMTFTVNTDGIVQNNGIVTAYRGTSQIVVIPDGVTEIGDNAFNYASTDMSGVSLVSVTVPATVTKIGKHAFENNYTLRRAVFLSETPAQIDFSAAGDPFRWPAGGFVIVVPEGCQDAYKAAWAGCSYSIKGSVEITQLPEFEIDGTTLVGYNKPEGSADALEITIPDDVTEIAANVFRGATFLTKVDLNNVTTVGDGAFYGCENLVEAVFTNVTEIGDGAFLMCVKLNSSGVENVLELPKVVSIGDNAFQNCEALRRVVIGASLTEVGYRAFYECQVYETQPALFIELEGDTPPVMSGEVTVGNISVKIQVKNIDVVIACFDEPTWSNYCKHLYVPSGEEKGKYMYGDALLDVDGRAEYQSSAILLYEIDGNDITFYEYEAPGTFNIIPGKIEGDTIRVTFGGEQCVFVKATGATRTYSTEDGKYTLECDPLDLIPSTTGATEIDAKLNGTAVKVRIVGFNSKTIKGFVDADGKKYDITLSFDGDTLVVSKRYADMYITDIEADDGSVINLHYTGNYVYVYGELKINVGSEQKPVYLSWSDFSTLATFVSDNEFTFTRDYRGTYYDITATLSQDGNTFEYSYTTR